MNRTILIVEDEVLIARGERIALEKIGYTVITAKTGESAIDLITRRVEIDLILMDMDLGSGIDGAEAARIILGIRDIPIVFLSNNPEILIMEKTAKVRSYGYIMKSSGTILQDAAIKMAFKLFEADKGRQ
jgi:CheY-like chemotaxis protein